MSTTADIPETSAAAKRFASLAPLVDVLLVFAVFAACGGWPVPDTNEAHYLTKAKHYWEPEWIVADLFLSSRDSHVTFYATFGYLTHILPLPTAALVARVVGWLMLAFGWRRLSYLLVPRLGWAALTGAAAVALNERFHLAGEWFVGGIEAKVPAYALVFYGLADVFQRRWNRGLIALGAASAFHVLVGGWSVAACGLVWFADRSRTSLKSLLPGLIGGGALALVGVLPGLRLSSGIDPALVAQGNEIYVFERIAHHLWAVDFFPKFAVRHLTLYALLSAWCTWQPADGALRRLRWFIAAAATFALVGLGISYASPQPSAWAAGILKFYWFRLSDVALAMGVVFELATYAARPDRRAVVRYLIVAALAIIGLGNVGCLVSERVQSEWLPRGEKIPQIGTYHNWQTACEWIRDNTPRDALVLAPRPHMTFKWFAERAEYATRKDVPQDAQSLVEWRLRHEELYDELNPWVNYLPPERVKTIVEKYGVDYIIAYADPPLEFDEVYRNNSFVVYRVSRSR